jgi:glycosyltransferase involved in cell wall biosynthesis
LEDEGLAKVSALILAYNEETKIEAAIKSVTWADETVVIDSGSSDRTAEIAEQHGCRVVQVPFEGFGKLRNSAVEACYHEWIFSLDADERCTPEALAEISTVINSPDASAAYYIPRRNYFMGRWIRHSGWYPDYRQPQLFKKGSVIYTDDMVHEGVTIDGSIGYIKNPIWQIPFQNISQIMNKMDRYSTLGSQKLAMKGVKGSMAKALIHALANFLKFYFIKLAFLDGWAGFMIALNNFEATFYKYAKLYEMQSLRHCGEDEKGR